MRSFAGGARRDHLGLLSAASYPRHLEGETNAPHAFRSTSNAVYPPSSSLPLRQLLLALAERQGLAGKIEAMRRGEKINHTERRAVLHAATRAAEGDGPIPVEGGRDAVALVHEQQRRIKAFTDAVRAGAPGGAFLGYTGRPIKTSSGPSTVV